MNNDPRSFHVAPINMDVGCRQIIMPSVLSVFVAKVSGNGNFQPLLCTVDVGGKVIQFKQALNL